MIPLPDKKYSIIYADPPWSYQNRGTRAEPSGPTGQTAAAYADNPTEAEQMTLGSAT